MSENESFKKDESYKKFLARVRAILWVWFVSTPFIIGTYLGNFARPVSLSLLAFAVITTWIVLHRIMTDDKENLSKNIDILRGNEGTKETSDEEAESAPNEQVANSINIPEDYIPKSETEQTTNTLNLGGNDLGKEIGSTSVFLFIFVPAYFYFVDRFFLYMHAFKILFVCSLLYSLLALWRLRKAYFKEGWVKVFARPNNIVEEERSTGGGRMRIRVTEGWTFTVDGQQYNVRQGSENHYKKEKEIYWNPQNNKLIINHNSYKVLFFLYSLVAYFFFFTGLLLSGQLALHPLTAYPVNVLLFAPVLPIGIIIFCEMYFNQVTLRTVFLNLRDSLLLIVLFLTAFSLLYVFFAVRNWFFSATECSFWIWLTQDFTGVNC
jgi:membrane protein implicated in regulation of membrane protease activity